MLQSEAVKYNPAIHAGEIVFYGKVVYKQGSLIEIQIAVLTLRQRHREIFNSAVTRSVLETDLTFDDRNLNIILLLIGPHIECCAQNLHCRLIGMDHKRLIWIPGGIKIGFSNLRTLTFSLQIVGGDDDPG